jgi:hypothetical protein
MKHLLFACAVLAFAPSTLVAQEGAAKAPSELIAVSVEADTVLLATEARVQRTVAFWQRPPAWRFRAVALRKGPVTAATLSRDATVLRVILRGPDSRERFFDLTKDVSIAASELTGVQFEPAPESHDGVARRSELDQAARAFLQKNGFKSAAEARQTPFTWVFFRVQPPDLAQYAPLFLLQGGERITPDPFEVWDDINPEPSLSSRMKKEPRDRALLRNYRSLSPSCHIYTRIEPHDGSWLAEYWLYYPFDVGFGGHLHDSEHIFVEIDVLGGIVRRVAGAGHGGWAPNSIYHTFSFDAAPIAMPLQALVELGKHATAPDINRDGFFTPGVDSNMYWDAAKVWGVRDNTGNTDSSYRPFDGTMAVPRFAASSVRSFTVKGFNTRYDSYLKRSGYDPTECASTDLGSGEIPSACGDPNKQCAESHVRSHPDFRHSTAILKPGIYPRYFLRVGAAYLPGPRGRESTFNDKQTLGAYLGYGLELQFPKVKLPGRVYGEAFFRESSTRFDGLAFTYEHLVTNLLGYYTGLSWFRDLSPDSEDSKKGLWLTYGALYEQPIAASWWPDALGSGLNLNSRFGFSFDNFFGLNWEVRAGVGVTFGTRFRKFGIRGTDPTPF